MKRAISRLVRRLRSEDGNASLETLLMLPFLVGCIALTLALFDAFKTRSAIMQAGETVGDMVSRQQSFLTDDRIDTFYEVHTALAGLSAAPDLRIALVHYQEDEGHSVVWSAARGAIPELTDSDLGRPAYQSRLPAAFDGERFIVVESVSNFIPILDIGLDAFRWDHFVALPPRFSPQICYNADGENHPSTTVC